MLTMILLLNSPTVVRGDGEFVVTTGLLRYESELEGRKGTFKTELGDKGRKPLTKHETHEK